MAMEKEAESGDGKEGGGKPEEGGGEEDGKDGEGQVEKFKPNAFLRLRYFSCGCCRRCFCCI